MSRILGLVLLCTANACQSPAPTSAGTSFSLEDALFELAEETSRELALPAPDQQSARRRLDRLERALHARCGRCSDPPQALSALRKLIFERERYGRQLDRERIPSMLLPTVLGERAGSCLGLSGLLLVLAERLQLPLAGVLVPGHFFLRLRGGAERHTIETLRGGEAMLSGWYRQRYHPPAQNPLYLRELSPRESLAVFRFNRGHALRRKGALGDARRVYQQVVAALPRYAEAWASLGLVNQLQGDRLAARRCYRRALALSPALDGVRKNLAALSFGGARAPRSPRLPSPR